MTKSSQHKRNWFLWSLRLAGVFVCVALIFFFVGKTYVSMLVPLITWGVETSSDKYEVRDVQLINQNNIEVIQYEIRTHETFVDQDGKTWPASDQTAGIHSYTTYIIPIITLPLLFTWPFLKRKDRLLAAFVSLPLICMVQAVDIPVNLLYTLKESYNTDSLLIHMDIAWYHEFLYHFFNSGGRQFLAIVIVMLAVAPFHLSDKKRLPMRP